MIHVVVMKYLTIASTISVGLPLLIHVELLWRSLSWRFKNWGVGIKGFVYWLHSPGWPHSLICRTFQSADFTLQDRFSCKIKCQLLLTSGDMLSDCSIFWLPERITSWKGLMAPHCLAITGNHIITLLAFKTSSTPACSCRPTAQNHISLQMKHSTEFWKPLQ
jgi:hypothetical protein